MQNTFIIMPTVKTLTSSFKRHKKTERRQQNEKQTQGTWERFIYIAKYITSTKKMMYKRRVQSTFLSGMKPNCPRLNGICLIPGVTTGKKIPFGYLNIFFQNLYHPRNENPKTTPYH